MVHPQEREAAKASAERAKEVIIKVRNDKKQLLQKIQLNYPGLRARSYLSIQF